ncbi:hypothetical protein HOP38_02720 [Vibrio mediterranei]|uniref:hypothetical protein n=1 Tax=Vibrio mediterranei TaxID=689 RepID=UPI00185D776C|nr:hypothetical protein [Vibrio mediterranei]NUW71424.1 hypothetical protein [Vibrio mediterranei]
MAGFLDSTKNFLSNYGDAVSGLVNAGAGAYNAINQANQHERDREQAANQFGQNLQQQRELSLASGQQYNARGGQQSYENTLWGPQELALRNQFSMANANMQNGPYTGDRFATWTPYQKQTFGEAVNYYSNEAPAQANYLTDTGRGMISNYGNAEGVYNGIAQNGGVDSGVIGDIMQSQQPYINNQINSVSNQVNRNADRQTAMTRENLAGSGGLSGTRGAVAQGLIREGANNAIADATTSINTNAYNNALTQANQNVNNRMSAANNLASLANRGVGMYGQGVAMRGDILNSRANIGSASQANDQNVLNNNYARWMSPWDMTGKYAALVGGRQWGGGRTQNTFQSTYAASNNQPYNKDTPPPAQTFQGAVMPWTASGMRTMAPGAPSYDPNRAVPQGGNIPGNNRWARQ